MYNIVSLKAHLVFRDIFSRKRWMDRIQSLQPSVWGNMPYGQRQCAHALEADDGV
jgi:hypothetical protein